MGIFDNARAPVSRGHMCDGDVAMPVTVPPVHFNNVLETEIGNQIKHVMWNNDRRRSAPLTAGLLYDGAQRWTMKVVKMSVRHQHQVDGGQVADIDSWLAQPLEHEQPAGEIRIDEDVQSADLHKKTGMANESKAQFSIGDQCGSVNFAGTRRDHRAPNQPAKLAGTSAKSGISYAGF